MEKDDSATRPVWLSQAFHGMLLAIVLLVVGVRLYGCFSGSDSQMAIEEQQVRELSVSDLRETAGTAFENKNWDLAADAYGRITELDPGNTLCRIRLAYALHASGQHDAALLEFLYLCRYEGNIRRWALYNAACSYALKGDKRLALDYLSSAVSEGFRPDRPISEDEDFASLKDNPEFLRLVELVKPYTQRKLYRYFDFLVGKWKLIRKNDVELGRFVVTKGREGSSIRGEYEDRSISLALTLFGYVAPTSEQWQHLWLDNQGNVIDLQGVQMHDKSLVMTGSHTSARAKQRLARAIYTPLDDGTAKLELSTSGDEGTTWQPILDATLVPNNELRETVKQRDQ